MGWTILVLVAVIFYWLTVYGGTILLGGIGIWLFVRCCKTRDQQKCVVVAVVVGAIAYGLLVALPSFLFEWQFDLAKGPPMERLKALSETFVGRLSLFSSFFGMGLSILFAGVAPTFLPKTTDDDVVLPHSALAH